MNYTAAPSLNITSQLATRIRFKPREYDNGKKLYTFSEITSKKELEEAFKLRFMVYSGSESSILLKQNSSRIDINIFDIHSRHYAIKANGRIIGYLRTVLPRNELVNESVIEIGEKYGLLSRKECFNGDEKALYPFLSYNETPSSHHDYYKSLRDKNEAVVEVSRLIIHPEFRSINSAKFLLESALVLYTKFCFGKIHSVVDCFRHHAELYKRYGFTIIPGGEYLLFGMPRYTLSLPMVRSITDSTVPSSLHGKLLQMCDEFNSKGETRREW